MTNNREKMVVRPHLDEPLAFSEGLVPLEINNKFGYMDKAGQIVIKPQFNEAYQFSEGLVGIQIEGKWGYIDKNGEIVIKPQFGDAYQFKDGFAGVRIGNKWGYINKIGEIVIKHQFDGAYSFSEGLAVVNSGGKGGHIDRNGNLVIEPKFDGTYFFSQGLSAVNINNKWGYIDKSGKTIIEPQFDEADSFSNGLAKVVSGDDWGYIDKTGKYVWRFKQSSTVVDTIQAFGFTLGKASKDEVRNKLKTDGIRKIQVKDNSFCDTYSGRGAGIEGIDTLTFCYTAKTEILAEVVYQFISVKNTTQFYNVRDILLNKYGSPANEEDPGNSLGKRYTTWKIGDCGILLSQDWPPTEVFLTYVHQPTFEIMARQIEEAEEAQKKKEFQKQKDKF